MKALLVILVLLAGLVVMACSDNSDESVADIIGSEGATAVANTIAESGFDAKNDEIGDAGNRKGDSLVCYTL